MRTLTRLALVALVIVAVLTPGTGLAAGALDAVYSVTEQSPVPPILTQYFTVVIQTGSTVGIANLFYDDGTWTYGFGTLVGNRVTGTLYDPDGSPYGTFNVTISGNTFSGQSVFGGYTRTITGIKIF
ncbi:MAG TPA: hypothetical protein VML54_10065 [Candidatus Limnocylindrales bacterium]|nr:hypothetical protein [Candidatus Limnocylindrales bacterium]